MPVVEAEAAEGRGTDLSQSVLSYRVRNIWIDSKVDGFPASACTSAFSLPLVCLFLWPWWKMDVPQFRRLCVFSLSSQQKLVFSSPVVAARESEID